MSDCLRTQYKPSMNYEELKKIFYAYFDNEPWLTEYKYTREFEKTLALLLNVPHCFTTNNGTISLSLALLAVGVKAGDEVLVPNLTMIATYTAVQLIGAIPVLVDVEEDTLCMNLTKAASAITPKTKALIYVSLNGRYKSIKLTSAFADYYNLKFIEDDAQSLHSRYADGTFIGSQADVASFSFSTPKIITTGQGGCLVTSNDDVAEKIKLLRDFGRQKGGLDIHERFGINSKFTDMQAIVGLSQLQGIPKRAIKKQAIYERYYNSLQHVYQVEFIRTDLAYTVPWFVDVYVERKQELMEYLKSKGIATRSIYGPLNKQRFINQAGDFSVSESFAEKGLWLPSSMELSDGDIDLVCEEIGRFYYEG